MIVKTTELTSEQLAECNQLIKKIQQHDRTFKSPYLSNQFNFFAEMLTLFLNYENNQLTGILSIYADGNTESTAEMAVFVDEKFRRQGIATRLIQAATSELEKFGYHDLEFWTEQQFLTDNPDFLKNCSLVADPETEIQLTTKKNQKWIFSEREEFQFRNLQASDIEALTQLQVRAFPETSSETAHQYLLKGLADEKQENFILKKNDQIIGTCAADQDDYDYIFGLFIAENWQNQGLGTYLLEKTCQNLTRENKRIIKIGVESNNLQALHLYQKVGFIIETEVIYLSKK
ncbi:GNAT family N-acetyltransferase [Enterococcus timonensis]|uniref:GNAT family N-acetyltransferase n=1 Tax=Enterococcus timonensis TaxID=1852364 RepID=UPI0008DAF83D|nr:GNAT family N-acetyltransferase [Enterococcus timonensis]